MPVLTRLLLLVLLPASMICALIYSTIWGGNGWMHARRTQAELVSAGRHRAEIAADVAKLEREVDQLRNDEATLRRAAAEDLLLVPKGSTIYRFQAANAGGF